MSWYIGPTREDFDDGDAPKCPDCDEQMILDGRQDLWSNWICICQNYENTTETETETEQSA